MKEFVGILLTLLISLITVSLSELLKLNPIVSGIIAVSGFILLIIFLFSYYLKQIDIQIENNRTKINGVNKDLNINNRLIKLEKDIEWLTKKHR